MLLVVLVVTFLASVWLIVRVPPRLHTPLMSMTNAVSGITVLGALLLFTHVNNWLDVGLGAIAIVAGSLNLVGGLAITDRMLRLFRKRDEPRG